MEIGKLRMANKKLIVLDAHAIIHRAYHALPDFVSDKGEPTGALYGLVSMLIKTVTDLNPTHVVAAYDLPKPTHRHHAYKEYKATRTETDTELRTQIDRSRDVFEAFGIPVYEAEGFEADDIIGTIVAQMKDEKDLEVIISSGDMDTLQLVEEDRVKVFTPRKGLSETTLYNEAAVQERYEFGSDLIPDYKGLRGDPSDNIPGIKGIGEKTATTLIKEFGTVEDIYKKLKKDTSAFDAAGITSRMQKLLTEGEEDALFSKQLAVIRDDAPIRFSLHESTWELEKNNSAVEDLFEELGFRTLRERMRALMGEPPSKKEEKQEEEDVDKKEVQEVGIMLWLLHSDMTTPSLEDIYAYTHTRDFTAARKQIEKELQDTGDLKRVYDEIEKPVMAIVEKMHDRGITIDASYLEDLSGTYHAELDKIQKKIFKHAGGEFNVNSPKQLAEVLYDTLELKPKNQKKTSTGQRSTRESELEKIKEEHAIVPEILEYRELQKLLSTYIDTLPKMLDQNSRLHATFLQAGTTTGRMASQNPNLQNIPNRSERGRAIRNAFTAAKKYTLVVLDYSQIELRIAAFLSGDEKLIDIFNRNQDVHQAVAAEVFNVPPEEITKDMRSHAKAINFGILYGMGAQSLRQATNSSLHEAQEYLSEYFKKYAQLAEFLELQKGKARQFGYTETFFGRRRYFEGISSRLPYVRASAERMALNAPIQGTQADIIKLAMSRVDTYLQKNKKDAHLLLQVHDELVYEVADVGIAEEIKKIMESIIDPKETHGVPLCVSVATGKNWGELKAPI